MAKSSTSFPPGESGNTKGRPRNQFSMTAHIIKELRKTTEVNIAGEKLKAKKHTIVAMRLVEKAMLGDMTAIRTILERVDGAPKQSVDVTGDIAQKILNIPESMTAAQRMEEFNRIMAEAVKANQKEAKDVRPDASVPAADSPNK
jgi:hypothetical protein